MSLFTGKLSFSEKLQTCVVFRGVGGNISVRCWDGTEAADRGRCQSCTLTGFSTTTSTDNRTVHTSLSMDSESESFMYSRCFAAVTHTCMFSFISALTGGEWSRSWVWKQELKVKTLMLSSLCNPVSSAALFWSAHRPFSCFSYFNQKKE